MENSGELIIEALNIIASKHNLSSIILDGFNFLEIIGSNNNCIKFL